MCRTPEVLSIQHYNTVVLFKIASSRSSGCLRAPKIYVELMTFSAFRGFLKFQNQTIIKRVMTNFVLIALSQGTWRGTKDPGPTEARETRDL